MDHPAGWTEKLTLQQKNENIKRYRRRCKLLAPKRSELLDRKGAIAYCSKRMLSDTATERIISLVLGEKNDVDYRDQRRLATKDRVPRSLEEGPATPPGYWNISI
jgi:hypothetical protein